MFDVIAMPFEIGQVFNAIQDVYSALPFVVKILILACFGVAIMFSIMKMLF